MKLLRVRGKNLASLAEPFELDFEAGPLAKANLFAIIGPTGAGKSTILDAVCLALYGRTPRLKARGQGPTIGAEDALIVHDPRSIVRRGVDHAYAEVWFADAAGGRWKAVWNVTRAVRGSRQLKDAELALTSLDDGRRAGGTKTETLAAIEARVGLDYERFVRTVLLAQGEFARLLHADRKERAEILEWLTGTDIYTRLSILAFERAQAEEARVEKLLAELGGFAPLGEPERAALDADLAAAAAALAPARALREAAAAARAWFTERTRREEAAAEAAATLEGATAAVAAAATLRAELAMVDRAATVAPRLAEADRSAAAAAASAAEATARRTEHQASEAAVAPAVAIEAAAQGALAEARRAHTEAAPALDQARALDEALARASSTRSAAGREREAAVKAAEASAAAITNLAAARSRATSAEAAAKGWLNTHTEAVALAAAWPGIEPSLTRMVELRRVRQGAAAAEESARRVSAEAHDAREAAATRREAAGARRQAATADAERAAAALAAFDPAALRARREALAAAALRRSTAATAHRDATAAAAALADEDTRIARALAEAEHRLARTAVLTAELPLRAAARDAARTLHDQLTARAGLSHHRATLRAGDPCPLCGATEHPFAGTGAVDELLDEARNRVGEHEAAVGAVQTELAGLEAAHAAGERELAAHRTRREAAAERLAAAKAVGLEHELAEAGSAKAAAALATLAEAGAAAEAALAAEEAAATAAGRTDEAARGALAATTRALEAATIDLGTAERVAAEAAAALASATAAVTARDGELEHHGARVAEALPSRASAALADPAAFTAKAGAEVAEVAKQRAAAEAAEREAARLTTEHGAAEAQATERATEAAHARAREHEAAAAERALIEERRTVIGGRAVVEVERELRSAEAAAAAGYDAAKGAVARVKSRAAEAQARVGDAVRIENDAAEAAQRAAEALVEALGKAELTEAEVRAAIGRGPGWPTQTRARLAELDRKEAEARGAAERARAAGRAHAEATPPGAEAGEAAAAEALADAEAADAEAQQRVGALRGRVGDDEARKVAFAARAEEVEAARSRAAVWKELSQLIGQKDGAKFRNFAQALTLDVLVGETNRHLQELAPRYRLDRVQHEDLDLQVIDLDRGNEVRGIPSLSGGETFLVSLALALGLSTLAANRQSVDCLFIDEGFGTLDPHSLDLALSVLDTLQASGRRVGIISHVSGLHERVGARVEVRPTGIGTSRVRTAAG